MMSQVTNGIFATPGQIAPLPTARPSRATSGTTKLVVTDADGQVLQSWVLKQPKCTLGSAESCTIACSLPGIAPIHALIVTGARQTFVRSLAGKLSQDGIPTSELLLSENKSYFELAGYRFALIRKAATENREEQIQAQRMRFALARPMSISAPTEITKEPHTEEKSLSAPWVANVIREAIEPLEAQIDSLLLPLAEFQAQSLQAQLSAARELEEEKRKSQEKARNTKEVEIVNMVAQQSANMETLAERISDVNTQLSTIERIIAQDAELNANAKVETNKIVSVQQTAIEQLQVGMVSVSESIKLLQEQQRAAQNDNQTWKNEVQLQLQQLTSAVSEFSDIAKNNQQPELLEAIESLKQTHEVAQSEIQRWQQGVQKQLDVLQERMQENAETVREQVPSQLAEAITEIQSKHEQTLAELQSWKSELRQEMQDLLQSAFESRDQQPTAPTPSLPSNFVPAHSQPVYGGFDSLSERGPNVSVNNYGHATSVDPLPQIANHSALQSDSYAPQADSYAPSNYLPQDTNATPIAQVAHNQFVSDEQFTPEIVSDEMVRSVNDQLHYQDPHVSSPVQDSEPWPTLQVATDHTMPVDSADAFGSQWSIAPTSEVLENQPSPNGEMAWGLPEESLHVPFQQNHIEQRDFGAPQSETNSYNSASLNGYDGQSVNESQSFFMPTSESADRIENHSEGSADLSMSNLFPNADWNANDLNQPESSTIADQPIASFQPVEQPPIDYSLGHQNHGNVFAPMMAESSAHEASSKAADSAVPDLAWSAPSPTSIEPQPKSEARGGSALPSWWTDSDDDSTDTTVKTSPSNAPLIAEDVNQQSELDRSQLDQASLQQDLSSFANASVANHQDADGQAFFGLGLEKFNATSESSALSPSANASSFDRFMQREQSLDDLQEQSQSDDLSSQQPWNNEQPSNFGQSADAFAGESELGIGAFDRLAKEASLAPAHRDEVPRSQSFGTEAGFDTFTSPDATSGATPEYQFPSSTPIESYSPAAQKSSSPSAFGSAPAGQSGEEDEESVEAYMKNLLARMRGDSVEVPASAPTPAPSQAPATPTRQSPYELRQAMRMQPDEGDQSEPMDLDTYVPLTNAPEKGKNISALRDLANSTARTAIHKSTRRRTLSGSLMKFAISAIALTVAAALFAINGVAVNIALIATMAALFVAMIWGYDGIKSLKPLLQNSLVLQPTNVEPDEELEEE